MINEIEKDKLSVLADDEILLNAIKKIFSGITEKEKPNIGEVADNALLGEKYRAYLIAIKIVERGFFELMTYKIVKSLGKSFDKSR